MSGLPGYDAWKTTEPEDLYDYEGPDDEEAPDEDEPVGQCSCGGQLLPLGYLGDLLWSRCRNCGMEWNTKQDHWMTRLSVPHYDREEVKI